MSNHLKTYPFHQSPLYKLSSKKKLYAILHSNKKDISDILSNSNTDKYLVVFEKNGRKFYSLKGNLKKINKRIFILLSKIETPNYLFSKKGYSYIDNAKYHQKNKVLFNIDIQKFFPNISENKVFKYFLYYLRMPPDISKLMCKFTVFDNHLAQGLSTSSLLSYLVNQKMFSELYNEVKDIITMSIYVDDISFSSYKNISKLKQSNIIEIVNKFGYEVKKEKIKYFSKSKHKHITGVVISPDNKLRIPNKLREKIIKETKNNDNNQTIFIQNLLGRISSARNIEQNAFQSILNKIKKPKIK